MFGTKKFSEVKILELLALIPAIFTIEDIASITKLSKPTIYQSLSNLKKLELIISPKNGLYKLNFEKTFLIDFKISLDSFISSTYNLIPARDNNNFIACFTDSKIFEKFIKSNNLLEYSYIKLKFSNDNIFKAKLNYIKGE